MNLFRKAVCASLFLCLVLIGSATLVCAQAPRFAYAVNFNDNNISGYTVNATTGALTPMSTPTFASGLGPTSIAISHNGVHVYVTNFNANTVSAYGIVDTTGALVELSCSPFTTANGVGQGPMSIVIDLNDFFVYVANTKSNTISGFFRDNTTGCLTPNTASPSFAGSAPVWVTVDPAVFFVYAANLFSNNVSGYSIDFFNQGNLTELASSPYPAGQAPTSTTVDAFSQFVFVPNEFDNTVSAYQIEGKTIGSPTGNLIPAPGSPYATGVGPTPGLTEPSGAFFYVPNFNDNNIFAYSIDASTGALSKSGTFLTGSGPASAAIDPAGNFVYVPNALGNTVTAYTLNKTTGALTRVGDVAAGAFPLMVAVTQ